MKADLFFPRNRHFRACAGGQKDGTEFRVIALLHLLDLAPKFKNRNSSEVSRQRKSSGKRDSLRLTAWISARTGTEYQGARSELSVTRWPRGKRILVFHALAKDNLFTRTCISYID
jgi:hypothetical protein